VLSLKLVLKWVPKRTHVAEIAAETHVVESMLKRDKRTSLS
jgi:hypothetical protein